MGPTCGPSGADMTQVGPMLAPWTLLSGLLSELLTRVWHFIPRCLNVDWRLRQQLSVKMCFRGCFRYRFCNMGVVCYQLTHISHLIIPQFISSVMEMLFVLSFIVIIKSSEMRIIKCHLWFGHKEMLYVVCKLYDLGHFLQNVDNRSAITRLPNMWCVSLIQSMCFVLNVEELWCMQYHFVIHLAITRADNISNYFHSMVWV